MRLWHSVHMQAKNHVPFAMSCWWLYAIAVNQPLDMQGTITAGLAGLLPDLDHPDSVIGRKARFISIPLSSLFGHRGITHSLFAVGAMLAMLIYVTDMPLFSKAATLITPVCVGYLSHLLGDFMTVGGIPALYPSKKRYSLNLFRTFSKTETAAVGCFTFAVLIFSGAATTIIENSMQTIALVSH